MPPLRGFSFRLMSAFYEDVARWGWVVRLMSGFYEDAISLGLCLVMAKAGRGGRCTQPHAEAWG
ncbi:MAG: hypothetical protein J0L94_08360 [Rhodothermia bacterium]|nr:hypothetical protein [Rhodothermia bacterium]